VIAQQLAQLGKWQWQMAKNKNTMKIALVKQQDSKNEMAKIILKLSYIQNRIKKIKYDKKVFDSQEESHAGRMPASDNSMEQRKTDVKETSS
jgi:hypothetical protein